MEPQPTETSVTPMNGPESNNIEVNGKKKKTIKEDGGAMVGGAPVNSVSSGEIAGLGVASKTLPGQAEPGVHPGKKKKLIPFKTFRRNPPL